MNPLILSALIQEIAVPELAAWLKSLHEEGRVVTEEEALAKLDMDIDEGNAAGQAFLDTHGG